VGGKAGGVITGQFASDGRCGHNYNITTCPYEHCVSRQLYEALAALSKAVVIRGCLETEKASDAEWATAVRDVMSTLAAARDAIAKVRGESTQVSASLPYVATTATEE
jgi:hypothetical protein